MAHGNAKTSMRGLSPKNVMRLDFWAEQKAKVADLRSALTLSGFRLLV